MFLNQKAFPRAFSEKKSADFQGSQISTADSRGRMAALENSQRIYPCMYMNFNELCGRSCVFYSLHIFASFATREDHKWRITRPSAWY